MKEKILKNRKLLFMIFYVLLAIGLNFLGSLMAEIIVFPLYLDSLFTISVVSLFGLIPGILCAFFSNVCLSLWTQSSLLFSVCHICTAVLAWCVFRYESEKQISSERSKQFSYSIDSFLWAGILSALSNAIIGDMIAGLVFSSQPPLDHATIVTQGLFVAFENLTFANIFAGVLENLVDKILSAILSFCMYQIVRKRLKAYL